MQTILIVTLKQLKAKQLELCFECVNYLLENFANITYQNFSSLILKGKRSE